MKIDQARSPVYWYVIFYSKIACYAFQWINETHFSVFCCFFLLLPCPSKDDKGSTAFSPNFNLVYNFDASVSVILFRFQVILFCFIRKRPPLFK